MGGQQQQWNSKCDACPAFETLKGEQPISWSQQQRHWHRKGWRHVKGVYMCPSCVAAEGRGAEEWGE